MSSQHAQEKFTCVTHVWRYSSLQHQTTSRQTQIRLTREATHLWLYIIHGVAFLYRLQVYCALKALYSTCHIHTHIDKLMAEAAMQDAKCSSGAIWGSVHMGVWLPPVISSQGEGEQYQHPCSSVTIME